MGGGKSKNFYYQISDEAVRLISIALEKRKDDMDMVGVGPTAPSV